LSIRDDRVARDESLRAAIEQASSLVSTTRGLRTQLTSAQTALAQIDIPLQPATSINLRVAELTTLAGECKLEMDAIQPGTITHSPRFGEIPIQISGRGTYRTMADFLHRLRRQFPDTAIRAFELSATPEDPNALASFNVRLVWYVQSARSDGLR
jgi:Tfp pilus assembly protein PilO